MEAPVRLALESTIIGFPEEKPTVLRKGGLAVEALEEILGYSLAVKTHSSSRPDAPGMLSKHYSPGVEMILLGKKSAVYTPISHKDALITFGKYWRPPNTPKYDIYNLSPSGDLAEAATKLFAVLREISRKSYTKVYVNDVPDVGLGRAINDRLRRAAATEYPALIPNFRPIPTYKHTIRFIYMRFFPLTSVFLLCLLTACGDDNALSGDATVSGSWELKRALRNNMETERSTGFSTSSRMMAPW